MEMRPHKGKEKSLINSHPVQRLSLLFFGGKKRPPEIRLRSQARSQGKMRNAYLVFFNSYFISAQEGSRANFIISSGGLGVQGLNLYQSYNTETNRTSYELSLATTTKLWSLTVQRIPVIPFGWVHVCITWSEAWGLRYYENGLLIKTQLTFEEERTSHNQNQALVGRSTSVSVSWTQFHLQVSELKLTGCALPYTGVYCMRANPLSYATCCSKAVGELGPTAMSFNR